MLRQARAQQKHVQAQETHDFPVVELILLLHLLLSESVRERRQKPAHRTSLARAHVTAAEWESPTATAEMGAWAKCCGSGSPRARCGNKAMDLSHAHVSHSRGHCRGPTDVAMVQTSLVSWLGHGAKLKPSACLPGETALCRLGSVSS
jgi:hypothetical protein